MNIISASGRIGKDAETRFTQSGEPVTSFSVADDVYAGKEKQTIWWTCTYWGKRGEAVSQYLRKGASVTVVGQVSERKWQDKDGMERKSMEIRVVDVALQGGKQDNDSAPRSEPRQAQRQAPQPQHDSFGDDGSDLPF